MPHVRLPEFSMHYHEQGTGPEPIVFVHGFISTYSWWLPTLERLSQSDYHAYAVDLRACGESDQIDTGHTVAQHADDLHAFVDALGLERFTLVGHSLGGGISMQYALKHQDRLKALVLVDPLGPSGTTLTPENTAWVNAQQGNPEGIRLLVLGAFATPPTGAYLERLVDEGVRWDRPIYLGMMDDMAAVRIADQLGTISVPTLVTWGDKDTVIPFPAIVETFTSIPGCSLEVWHGVGHSGPIEIPERFTALLTQFMRETMAPKVSAG
jgi:branched-chain amino acid transport system permease protein